MLRSEQRHRGQDRVCRRDGILDGQSASPSHWLNLKCELGDPTLESEGPDDRRQRGEVLGVVVLIVSQSCMLYVGGLGEIYFT